MLIINRKNVNKGFSLAELLIVVAIIAVLVAIAIPVFHGTLERSKEATDLANIRAAYAKVMYAALEETGSNSADVQGEDKYIVVVKYSEGSSEKYKIYAHAVQLETGWQSGEYEIDGVTLPDYDSQYENKSPRFVVDYNKTSGTLEIKFDHD